MQSFILFNILIMKKITQFEENIYVLGEYRTIFRAVLKYIPFLYLIFLHHIEMQSIVNSTLIEKLIFILLKVQKYVIKFLKSEQCIIFFLN